MGLTFLGLRLCIIGLSLLALPWLLLLMLTIALRLITIELASAIGSLAASGLVRSVFGALPVLRRIFHVYVLVKAFCWPLTILRALSIALTFLMISITL